MRDFHLPGRSALMVSNAAVATSHPLAAQVALDLMREGGNAVDAAICGALMLGICEPGSTGIGGDMFAIVKPAGSDALIGLNANGRSPHGATAEALRAAGHSAVPAYTGEGVTVPGAVAGFVRLAEDHGAAGLERILAPVIRYAEEGVPVAPRVAWDWIRGEQIMTGAMRRHYLKDDRPYALGEIFRQPGQAEVFRRIAAEGAAGFYAGEVAEDMVASLRAVGGQHTPDDFAAMTPDYVEPISGFYKGHEIVELPPSGQGAIALIMAGILERFDIAGLEPFGAARAHLEAEAAKLAYAIRDTALGDPDHMSVTMDELLSPDLAARLARQIDPAEAKTPPRNPMGGAPHRDTIYIATVDPNGMAVSLIYSIFHGFGSGLASERFGINFNNRASGFCLEPGHPNEYGPNKRPLHTIIPGFLKKDGRAIMPFGVMGGQYQPAGHMRLVSNMLDYGLDPQEALDAPRSFPDPETGRLALERGYGEAARGALAAMGHAIETPEVPHGGGQAILMAENGVLIAGTDPRKDGVAIGY